MKIRHHKISVLKRCSLLLSSVVNALLPLYSLAVDILLPLYTFTLYKTLLNS